MMQEDPELVLLRAQMSKSSVIAKEKAADALQRIDEAGDKNFDWESNRDDENPNNLPWPEENESKE
jgi:hypothetical protein